MPNGDLLDSTTYTFDNLAVRSILHTRLAQNFSFLGRTGPILEGNGGDCQGRGKCGTRKGARFRAPFPCPFSQEEEEEQIGLQLKDWAGRL